MPLPLPPSDERDRHVPGLEGPPPEPAIESPEEGFGLEANDDGSILVTDIEDDEEDGEIPFGANLADHLPEGELSLLADTLRRHIDEDIESRKKRDEQYAEGLKRSGMDGAAPGGAQFEGASRATHPMLAEACVDFAASAMRELLPADTPVRTKIEGQQTEIKLQVAERQNRLLSWQMTDQIAELIPDVEQLLTQLPMGGSQYLKLWRDRLLRRVVTEFVPVDDMILPFAAASYGTAERRTHRQTLTQMTVESRIESGFYRDLRVVLATTGGSPPRTKAEEATDRIEGKTDTGMNLDGERIVYEVDCYCQLSIDDDERRPYLVSIDELTNRVLGIYRNWREEDPTTTRLDWAVEFGFIPWRGAYKVGLPHLIGGLSIAATGSLRALLDSAHINNAATLLKMKSARFGGQSTTADVTQVSEIEGPPGIDDIRKLAMPFPFNPPSVVLYQLLGWLTDAAKGVVTTAEEKIAENAGKNMPVGTTLALIEQGSRVMSSIHRRLHRSMAQVLKILARLNREHLTDEEQIDGVGEILATRRDFQMGLFVQPISDPNIFSETQRFAQNQAVLQMSSDPRVQYDVYQIHRRMLMQMRIPDPEQILPEPRKPTELNAAAENMQFLMRAPVMAFPAQDHLAHIETHVRFLMDPMLFGGMGMAESSPAILEHLKQHLGFLYVDTVQNLVARSLPGANLGMMLKDPRTSPVIDQLIASASRVAHAQLRRQLQPLGPVMQQLAAQIQAMRPPPPMDPSAVAAMDVRAKAEKGQAEIALKKEKDAREARQAEVETVLGFRKQGAEEDKTAAELSLRAKDLELREEALRVKEEADARREMNEAAKFALQLEEDRRAGNQIAGV